MENEIMKFEEVMEFLSVGKNTLYALLNSGEIQAFRIGKVWKIPRKVSDSVCGGEACGEGLKKAEHACKKIQAYKHYSNGCRNALQETICRATVMSSYNRSRQSPALPPFL